MADKRHAVPEWLIERLVAGDLPKHRAADVRAQLAASGQLARLRELPLANLALLSRYPTRSVVGEIARRLETSEAVSAVKARWAHRIERRFSELWPRIARVAAGFAGGAILTWIYRRELLMLSASPFIAEWRQLHSTVGAPALYFSSPVSMFIAYLRLAGLGGAIVAFPIAAYELCKFVASRVRSPMKRFTAAFVVSTSASFALGAWSAWRFMPEGFGFLMSFAAHGYEISAQVLMGDYVEFLVRVVLVAGFAAQLPALAILPSVAGIITPRKLMRFFPAFGLLALVFAAVVTPADPVSTLLVAVPLCALYMVSVGVAFLAASWTQSRLRQ